MGIEEILGFLAMHADLVKLVYDALTGGAAKEDLVASIKKAMVEANDAAVRKELGL